MTLIELTDKGKDAIGSADDLKDVIRSLVDQWIIITEDWGWHLFTYDKDGVEFEFDKSVGFPLMLSLRQKYTGVKGNIKVEATKLRELREKIAQVERVMTWETGYKQ